MNSAVAAVQGMVVKAAVMLAVALLCMLGARLSGNVLIRRNPQWSKGRKQAVHALATFAAVVVFALFLIGFAGGK
jgi:hypothetical protein